MSTTEERPTAHSVHDLLDASGVGADAQRAFVANLDETVLMGCVGLGADQLDTADATLVSVVLDMSGSMAAHKKAVIESVNAMLDALAGAKASSAILVSLWAFADRAALLSSYEPVERKPKLSGAVYAPDGCTALYDATLGAMTGLCAYGQRLYEEGVPTRRILFVLSDGEDNCSKVTSRDVQSAARALAKDEIYTLAYAGFGGTDLSKQADTIGFTSTITTGASAAELRKIFRQVSQSVIRVSSGTMPLGGFF